MEKPQTEALIGDIETAVAPPLSTHPLTDGWLSDETSGAAAAALDRDQ